jgi:hypothetical protein
MSETVFQESNGMAAVYNEHIYKMCEISDTWLHYDIFSDLKYCVIQIVELGRWVLACDRWAKLGRIEKVCIQNYE